MTLMAVMTLFFPPNILIPLHGVVQLSSNASRAALNAQAINKRIILHFGIGACIGALLVSQVVFSISEAWYRLLIGVFILVFTWFRMPKAVPKVSHKFFWVGLIATFLSVLVGAVGPLIAPFYLKEGLSKKGLIATQAASQTLQHLLKIIVFGFLGFVFSDYALLLVCMVLCAVLGSWTGRFLLGKVNEELFKKLFKWGISLLAVRMIVIAIQGIFL